MKLFDRDREGANPDGTFKDHVAGTTAGTKITANIFNQLGEETNAIIKSGGLTPDSNTVNQLDVSIKKQIADAVLVVDKKIDTEKEELNNRINGLQASNISYNNSVSKLEATNVQDAINELQSNRNIIFDEQEHSAGYYYNGKPVYYRAFNNIYRNATTTWNSGNIWNIDDWVSDYFVNNGTNAKVRLIWTQWQVGDKTQMARLDMGEDKSLSYNHSGYQINSTRYLQNPIFYYTKTTDSRVL